MDHRSAARVRQHVARGGTLPPCARSAVSRPVGGSACTEPSRRTRPPRRDSRSRPGPTSIRHTLLGCWQRLHCRSLNGLEQFAPADPEAAHHPSVQLHQNLGDRRVAFGEGEELQVAQSAQHVELSDAYSSFNFGFVFRVIRPCRQNADTVMCGHGAITAVDLGIVERGLVHSASQIVGHQEARPRTPEAKHPHVCADPVRQALCPGRLRVGEIGRAQYATKISASRTAPVSGR